MVLTKTFTFTFKSFYCGTLKTITDSCEPASNTLLQIFVFYLGIRGARQRGSQLRLALQTEYTMQNYIVCSILY